MAKRRTFFLFLFITFGILTIASCLLLGLWKLGIGEWAFLAGVICLIVAVAALLYAVSQLEKPKTDPTHRRISFLVYSWLVLGATAILFFALGKTGAGEWTYSMSMLAMGLFVLGPPVWFVIQPDLGIVTFNVLSGDIHAPEDWKALSPFRRIVVYMGTLLFLAIGILLIIVALQRLSPG